MHHQSVFNLQLPYFVVFQFVSLVFLPFWNRVSPIKVTALRRSYVSNKPAWFARSKITRCWELF